MNRTWLLLGLGLLVLAQTGCASCKKLFGLDRRCETTPPPQYYQAPPMAAPVNYAPAPCNAPK